MNVKYCIVLCFFFLGPLLWGQGDELFKEASNAYNKGDYQEAANLYHQILEQDQHSAALYFNLGNSYYKLNRIAPSIYYYEKALLLDPDDTEIKNNLAFAQNMTLDAIEELPESDLSKAYGRITGILTFDQWAKLAVLLIFVFVIAISVYMISRFPKYKRISFIVGIVALAIAGISVSFAYVQYQNYQLDQPAIIFAEETAVRTEPNDRSELAFLLHEGTKVNVIEKLDEWQRIELENGQSGWLLAEDLKVLKDF